MVDVDFGTPRDEAEDDSDVVWIECPDILYEIESNPFDFYSINPNDTEITPEEKALGLLSDIEQHCREHDGTLDMEAYSYVLERLFTMLYQDLVQVAKMSMGFPIKSSEISGELVSLNIHENIKFLSNILVQPEYLDIDLDTATETVRMCFAAEFEVQYDRYVKNYDLIPEHWKPNAEKLITRTLQKIYQRPLFDPNQAENN